MEEAAAVNVQKVAIQIDSGADIPVWPPALCDDYPTYPNPNSERGAIYAAAGDLDKPTLKDQGSRHIMMRFKDYQGQPVERGAEVHIVDVSKPLMSLAHMNSMGHDFHAMADGTAWRSERKILK